MAGVWISAPTYTGNYTLGRRRSAGSPQTVSGGGACVPGGTYQHAQGRGFQGQDHVAAYTPCAQAEELLFQPSAPLGVLRYRAVFRHIGLLKDSSFGPSVEWEAPEMAAERLPDPSRGKCPVASPTPVRPTQIHPLLCCRHSPYQFFGRLLLGFSKQPHGLLNSSCPFRLSVARAQAGHGQPPGRGR